METPLREPSRELKVVAVRAGGVGSAVGVQLSKLGVGEVVIIDHDKIEESNLPCLYGAKKSDEGKPKASVLAWHLSSIGFSRKVSYIVGSAMQEKSLGAVPQTDVVGYCTDNQRSGVVPQRPVLSILHPKDSCWLQGRNQRPQHQSAVRVQVLGPGRPMPLVQGSP